ncbi:hypothetical protein AVEN_181877-1 [Araneus ventricosus]|uniref:Uncharacterized protein n=1 Tax=Araneus ventricosus TaxID=182803 RepID=A0A4Y2NSC0_ARAVE|nr:hypothetical protein AVEN_225075-1 [Araneus ventricosus]GBN41292.1 hypothetical protein AVEN_181877-1 [Araneus ventricosus]
MYTKTERWAAHCFNKFDFEEVLADETLFEEIETQWILEESPERTTKAALSSLGDDGLKRRRSWMLNWRNEAFHLQRKGWRDEDAGWIVEVWLVLNSLIAGGTGCPVTEVAIY